MSRAEPLSHAFPAFTATLRPRTSARTFIEPFTKLLKATRQKALHLVGVVHRTSRGIAARRSDNQAALPEMFTPKNDGRPHTLRKGRCLANDGDSRMLTYRDVLETKI